MEIMELNRETAMRLWAKNYGKDTRVDDFAGRTMDKSAYGDRESKFGWNVDHILPQSKGGKTADHNLVCCHILTNDEKADRFPAFVANGIRFEIIKVENHYEIRPVDANPKSKEAGKEAVNLFDPASGIRFIESLEENQKESRFVGSVLIRLAKPGDVSLVDFLVSLFKGWHISFFDVGNELRLLIRDYDMPYKENISKLLDQCLLAHAYLGAYFIHEEYLASYAIYYRVDKVDTDRFYTNIQKPKFIEDNRYHEFSVDGNYGYFYNNSLPNAVFVNDIVCANSFLKDKIQLEQNREFYRCDWGYVKLAENLRKEVGGK